MLNPYARLNLLNDVLNSYTNEFTNPIYFPQGKQMAKLPQYQHSHDKEASDNESESSVIRAVSTSGSESSSVAHQNDRTSKGQNSVILSKNHQGEISAFSINRVNSQASFLSGQDSIASDQMYAQPNMAYNLAQSNQFNQVQPMKRKSNICLSRENIMKNWTDQDDENLIRLADQYKNDWKKIAKRIITNNKKKVTPNFLKNRYKEVAGDHIKKGVKFTHDEDLRIAELFAQHGTSWTKIASYFPDRTPVMIKNRYYSHIRRKGLLNTLINEASGIEEKIENQESEDSELRNESESIYEEEEKVKERPIPQIQHLGQLAQFSQWNAAANAFFFPIEVHEPVDINRYFADDELHAKVTPYGEDQNLLTFTKLFPSFYN